MARVPVEQGDAMAPMDCRLSHGVFVDVGSSGAGTGSSCGLLEHEFMVLPSFFVGRFP